MLEAKFSTLGANWRYFLGKLLRLGLEILVFVVFSNFYLFYKLLFKSQNKVPVDSSNPHEFEVIFLK